MMKQTRKLQTVNRNKSKEEDERDVQARGASECRSPCIRQHFRHKVHGPSKETGRNRGNERGATWTPRDPGESDWRRGPSNPRLTNQNDTGLCAWACSLSIREFV